MNSSVWMNFHVVDLAVQYMEKSPGNKKEQRLLITSFLTGLVWAVEGGLAIVSKWVTSRIKVSSALTSMHHRLYLQ
jgi:hypothetical protein